MSKNELRVLHKHLFAGVYNESLNQAAEILTERNQMGRANQKLNEKKKK